MRHDWDENDRSMNIHCFNCGHARTPANEDEDDCPGEDTAAERAAARAADEWEDLREILKGRKP